MVDRAPPAEHPSPYGKGKGKISEIRYPSGSEYLKAAVKYADSVGSSRVEQQVDKEELQVARDELRLKTITLSLVCQEVVEAESTVGRLNKECHGLRDDLQR